MKIGYDAKRLYNNFTGLGNYSRFVVDGIHQHFSKEELFLFTPRVKPHPETAKYAADKTLRTITPSAIVSALKLQSVWRSVGISGEAARNKIDIFHGLSHELPFGISKKCKSVLTVHDLIFLRYPQYYGTIDRWIYKTKLQYACREADAIVAISEQTKQDLVDLLNVPGDKISVVYQGCHPNFHHKKTEAEKTEVRDAYGLPDNYLLSVGTVESRKNALVLVKALNALKDQTSIHLVIVGRHTAYAEQVKAFVHQNGLTERVHFITQAAFNDLPAIYQSAAVFIYPSHFEGFGIPLVEAIVSGVPVITSTGSCFREAAGPDAVYVDPNNHHALASAIQNVLVDEALRTKMITNARHYVKRFESSVIATEMMRVYRSLMK